MYVENKMVVTRGKGGWVEGEEGTWCWEETISGGEHTTEYTKCCITMLYT